jgi:hypothetical protein
MFHANLPISKPIHPLSFDKPKTELFSQISSSSIHVMLESEFLSRAISYILMHN